MADDNADMVRLVSKDVPFAQDRQVRMLEPGHTVRGILNVLQVGPAWGTHAVVTIEGQVVPEHWYDRVKPKRGTLVGVVVVPHGGDAGKAILSVVVGIGMVLAGAITLNPLLGLGGLAGIYSGARALAAPAPLVPYAGDIPTSKQSPTLTSGTRNTFRPYGPVVERFGRVLAVPEYAAKPFTELVGNDTYLRLLFDFGVGPLQLSDHKIGETPLAEFTHEIVVHEGWDDDDELSLFTQDVTEETPGQELNDDASAWYLRTTEVDTTEASIDLSFPSGLIAFDSSGAPLTTWVKFNVQYSVAGAGTWVDVTPTSLPAGMTHDVEAGDDGYTFSGRERGFIRRGFRWLFPAAGQYDVRVKRETSGVTGTPAPNATADDASWTKLRSIKPTTKPALLRTRRNLCLVELRILATGQLGQSLDQYNAVAERYLRVWSDLDGWGAAETVPSNASIQLTRDHAPAIQYVLRSVLADDRIDSASFLAAQSVLTSEGRTFDGAVDFQSTVRQVAADMCASARGKLSLVDGQYRMVLDRATEDLTAIFTPRNSRDLTAERVFRKQLHALRVNFGPHEAEGWVASQRVVYNDGYSADGAGGTEVATEFADVDLWGVTDPAIAYVEGRYQLAATQLQPVQVQLTADVESILCTTGDKVGVQTDTLKTGLGAGRITRVESANGPVLSWVELDDELTYDPMKSYAMTIRTSTGDTHYVPLWNLAGIPGSETPDTWNLFIANASVDLTGESYPQEGDLVVFGEASSTYAEYLVHSVRYAGELSASITLLPYNAAIYTSDTDPIPDWEPNLTTSTPPQFAVPDAPSIESMRSDESVLAVAPDGTLLPRVEVVVAYPGGTGVPADTFQLQWRLLEPTGEWRTQPFVDTDARQLYIDGVEQGQVLEVRVRAVSKDNRTSTWTTSPPHEVVGTSSPPPDVAAVYVEPPGDTLVWTYPDPPRDWAGFRIRHQAGSDGNWTTGIPAHDGLVTETRFELSGLPTGSRTIMVKAVDRAGNESVNAGLIVADVGDVLALNVVETHDFHTLGFPGTITNATVDGGTGDLEADTDATGYWVDDLSAFWSGTDSNLFWTNSFKAWSYEDDVSPTVSGRMFVELTVAGSASWNLQYKEDGETDWRNWPGSINALSTVTYDFLLSGSGGSSQGVVTVFKTVIDLPDLVEYLNDKVIDATSTPMRHAPTKSFTAILNVSVTIQDAVGGDNVVINDKSVSGPDVHTIDSGGTRVQRTVDMVYQGY